MGGSSSCPATGTIDTNNRCTFYELNKADKNQYEVLNFCADYGYDVLSPEPYEESIKLRFQVCDAMSTEGEWIYNNPYPTLNYNYNFGSSCTFDSPAQGQEVIGNCSSGRRALCQRMSYEGDPLPCCLADDKFGNVIKAIDSDTCFSDKAHQKTCPINNRDIISNQPGQISENSYSGSCQQLVGDYCVGRDVTDNSWMNRWQGEDSPCVHAVKRNLFTTNNIGGNVTTAAGYYYPLLTPGQLYDNSMFINSEGFAWSRDVIEEIMGRYRQDGFTLGTLPGYTGYNDFQNILYSICQNVPGLCQTQLNSMCGNDTTQRLINNPVRVQWCGCYMPNSEYATYQNNFGINRECTPICNRQGNIFQPNPSGLGRVTCQQGICVIDDVNLTLSATNVTGDVSINQVCGGCGGQSSCQCYILNTNITTVNSTIGGNINIDQACSATTCYRTSDQTTNNGNTSNTSSGVFDPNSSTTASVSCDAPVDYNPVDQNQQDTAEQEHIQGRNEKLYLIIAIVVVLVLVLFILLLAAQGHKPDTIIPRTSTSSTVKSNVGTSSINSGGSSGGNGGSSGSGSSGSSGSSTNYYNSESSLNSGSNSIGQASIWNR